MMCLLEPLWRPRLIRTAAARYYFWCHGKRTSVAAYNEKRYVKLDYPYFPRMIRDPSTGAHPIERVGLMRLH